MGFHLPVSQYRNEPLSLLYSYTTCVYVYSSVQIMTERRQPYGYRPIGQVPRVLNESLPERDRERARKGRQNQKSMKSYKVEDYACVLSFLSVYKHLSLCVHVYSCTCVCVYAHV